MTEISAVPAYNPIIEINLFLFNKFETLNGFFEVLVFLMSQENHRS